MKKNNYCECRIPSPSAHHRNCLNDGCGKRIKDIYEEYEELEQKNKKLEEEIFNLKKSLISSLQIQAGQGTEWVEQTDEEIDEEIEQFIKDFKEREGLE